MIPYILYLNLTGGADPNAYFEVEVEELQPFTEQPIDEMVVTRRVWGNVRLRNTPFNSVLLYDTIQAVLPTQEIHLKFVSDYETVYGYFGVVDAKVDDDNKNMTLKLTILDQYTPFIENRDNEIRLFDYGNIVRNGNFDKFTAGVPDDWTKNTPETVTTQIYFKEKSAILLPRIYDMLALNPSGIYQGTSFAKEGKNIILSFLYALIGDTSDREDLQFKVVLTGTLNNYDLNNKGEWITYNALYKATFKASALPIPMVSVNDYYKYDLVSDPLPENGSLTLVIYHQSDIVFTDDTSLIITQVRFETPTIELKTIKVNLGSENLVSAEQNSDIISWKSKNSWDHYFRTPNGTSNWNTALFDADDYFNVDGSPNLSELSSSTNGIKSRADITYQDLQNIFDSDATNPFYKGEISEITVYRGAYSTFNLRKNRKYYAIAKFSREEYYKTDELDGDGNPIPPAIDSGWFRTLIRNVKGEYLWVRKPFYGATITWEIGTLVESPKSTHPYGFVYHASITSKKQYPITEASSFEVETAIDFREVIRKVYCSTDDSLLGKNVYSTFFWNDSQTAEIQAALFPDGKTSKNYVSGEEINPLNKIAAIHTNDLSTEPSTDEEKSVLKISGKKLIDDIRVLFPQTYWYVDSTYNLHIEHIKFFDKTNSIKSLLGEEYEYIRNYKQWEYFKDKMFSLEEYEVKNSGYNDFKTSRITFDKIVSNKRGEDIKGSYTTQNLTTDIQYCIENPNSLDNGMILVCYETVGGDNIVKYGIGQKSGKVVLNGDLSISTLLYKYARYEGTFLKGKINDKEYTFEYTKRVRQGKEISIKGIFLNKFVLNNIGRGLMKSATIDYKNEITKAVFMYRYGVVEISNGGDNTVDTGGGDMIIRVAPTVITKVPTTVYFLITGYNILSGGKITSTGDSTITEFGICYSVSENPTILDTKCLGTMIDTTDFIAGDAEVPTGTYYLRAFATNSVGTSYGSQTSFIIP